jgi:hypothetical protein
MKRHIKPNEMKSTTYTFTEKNGNGVLILSAENSSDAFNDLGNKVKEYDDWELSDETENEID